jgi:hypothetical protein
LKEE